MKAKMIVLIGIPACGKSTWARQYASVPENNAMIVNRDTIRLTNFGVVFDLKYENQVTQIENLLVLEGLRMGKTVVVDKTNLRAKYRNDLKKLALQSGVEVTYEERFFPTGVDTCKVRNDGRLIGQGNVPETAMEKFIEQATHYYNGKAKPEGPIVLGSGTNANLEQDPRLPHVVICDLDGTLCLLNGRDPYDANTCDKDLPNMPVWRCCRAMQDLGHDIIFVSGRDSKFRPQTEAWLKAYWGPVCYLFMRPDGDTREDSIVKNEIFDKHIRNKYYVDFVLDDRPRVVRMWRRLGLTVFQLNDREF